MELRHLQTFAAAARLGSFTRAGNSLGITQAAVSQHIAALEKELSRRLFDRVKRSVRLTPAGERLVEYAAKILDLHDAAQRDIRHGDGSLSGSLRIAASTVPAEVVLPELLAKFREQYPQVHETVRIADSAATIRAVEQGEADLGIVGEKPSGKSLTARAIGHDELILVVAASSPLAARRRISAKQLRQAPLVLREPGSGSRHCVERALADIGLSLRDLTVAMEMNANDSIRQAVARGLAAAFLSRATIKKELAAGTFVQVTVPGLRAARDLYVISNPKHPTTAAAKAFLEFANVEGKPLRKAGKQEK
jgi:DNA-binding transcriptional LysR family regulator